MAKKQKQGKRSSAKCGRMKSWCQAYRAACRQEINKRRKLRRHIRRFPGDHEAAKALARLS